MQCEDCGYEFNYRGSTGTRSYYVIEVRNEMTRGTDGKIAYCRSCAPFGNTNIPDKLN